MATFIKISTITVGSGGAASIDFTSIPATYTDLKVVLSTRATGTSVSGWLYFNNDTAGSSYSDRTLEGSGTAASSGNRTGQARIVAVPLVPGTDRTANQFCSTDIYIPNYLSSNYKSVSIDSTEDNNTTDSYADLVAGLWANTSAITRVTINISATNFAQYSSATLYGIKSS